MRVGQKHYQSIWPHPEKKDRICVIDQRHLPQDLVIAELQTLEDAYQAIKNMQVRGAPLIGITAAYGLYLAALAAARTAEFETWMQAAGARLISARPTAVNLAWAVRRQLEVLQHPENRADPCRALFESAGRMAAEDIENCRRIGRAGLPLIEAIYKKKKAPVRILTHCNAGWLACVDWGTATAPIYQAWEAGIPVHVWVDETRPRNQGASLTAWELGGHGVPYTLIVDNAGGHLMQRGEVDLVLTGTDRTTRAGDVANKIGTYLKALAARDNGIPFYAAVPSSSIDWDLDSGRGIPIEERGADEVRFVSGMLDDGRSGRVQIAPAGASISNFGFDVTPARLVSGLLTERGLCEASEAALLALFPEKRAAAAARDEGVIKFEARWQKAPALPQEQLEDLLRFRGGLYQRGWIGVYPDGIGYGNLSRRGDRPREFIISGSQTGHLAHLAPEHFALVTDYDIGRNRLECLGPSQASSESLTHAMIYETFPAAGAVIHIHDPALWKKLKGKVPTSSAEVPYGTPQMALEIQRLAAESSLEKHGILVMAGHADGIIAFGENLESAWSVLQRSSGS